MTSLEVNAQNEDSGPGGYAADRLLLLHEKERSGPPRRTALARLTDDWLAGLFAAAAPPRGTALVAVGGYGRSELSPRSDLDLLLLHDGTADKAAIAALADRIWYPVWDLGLALDHSVRTPAEARATAADDLKVHLGLLDARPLAGDAGLVAALRTTVLADWRNQAPRRLPELDALCRERAERMGELQFLLEPDLKEARGGLRDAQALRAVAASWLADAPREGLDRARRRLLDTRDALHLTTGRATDRLALQEQDAVAAELGLLDADTLLREVYEAARTISYATDVTWREVNRVLKARSARPRLRSLLGRTGAGRTGGKPPVERTPLAEGVVEMDGEVVLARTARPERDPVLPLRAAAAAAQSGLPLSPHAVRRLAATAPPLPAPWPAEAREELVTLLGAGEATVPVWEALEAEGIVTRLLPDWERVRCRPQRNPVHTWTVDRHLVETAVRAASLTRRVGRPDLLLVAALLHDIGKGWPGDHSVAGETIARDLAARVGFDRTDTATVATAVRHHLLLVETATRRDLDDPATVESVAAAVGTLGTLELLHALTEADALATGPAAWSSWRASLVADLVKRVAGVLAGEPLPDPEAAAPSAEQERLAIEALRTGEPVLALHTRDEHAADPDDSDPDDSASDEVAPEPVGVELVIALPDQPGVLPAVAGVLALHRLTVRAADLRAVDLPTGLGSGSVLVLDWRVAAEYGSLPEAARLRADLVRALDGSLDIPARLAEREAAYPRRRGLTAPPPRVTVAAADSRLATVIEVRAQDAPGLLHRIGRALEGAAVRVRSAHVSTLGANAVDTLYVTRPDGSLLPPEEAVDLARTLEAALG
ncbi:bifunctional uridylyltransferase/uridylyl-removing enzyme [Streptomyces cinereoruber]|uniref:Bifunctional uridylyltransferase/uridylyl-removing enzyme n=1 Tax=Streptomyces cinereoruber TaxID=67260 RepID=A0AAV4KQ06_9ACTN|nr:[protein-PII] uridylyltransferase [Streptomyces cinereoruber]MBB4158382.1 [protein-PII] uridylyltransferase [Streptomyces cinereoruber]MBY8814339.1 [protein-PII] uridylyltransferase [Streptomyces cinereoruber]NIH59043.1 [protein-PII] uridylyltransferase [Streptomyces cinereoruber]QEV34996.1 [protein-PII] uridylyltransferase [Streptomyces cinereoruber]GGR46704.1 bifunctional uridylyltransferase/uridylyl-removing enzyme [Streptomyces cinereoruber]